jgi:hypothetical protein
MIKAGLVAGMAGLWLAAFMIIMQNWLSRWLPSELFYPLIYDHWGLVGALTIAAVGFYFHLRR